MGSKKTRREKRHAALTRRTEKKIMNNLADMLAGLNAGQPRLEGVRAHFKVIRPKKAPSGAKSGLKPEKQSNRIRGIPAPGVGLVFGRKKRGLSVIPEEAAGAPASVFGGPGGPVVPIHSARNVGHAVRNPVTHSSSMSNNSSSNSNNSSSKSNNSYKETMQNNMLDNLTKRVDKVGLRNKH